MRAFCLGCSDGLELALKLLINRWLRDFRNIFQTCDRPAECAEGGLTNGFRGAGMYALMGFPDFPKADGGFDGFISSSACAIFDKPLIRRGLCL